MKHKCLYCDEPISQIGFCKSCLTRQDETLMEWEKERTGGRMKNILIIEDNVSLARGMKLAFEAEGYKCKVAYRGYDVLALIKSKYTPDVIILDLFIPDLSGIELMSSLKTRWGGSRILIYSGFIPDFANRVSKAKEINMIAGCFTKGAHGVEDLLGAISLLGGEDCGCKREIS